MPESIRFARRVAAVAKPEKVEEFLSTMRKDVYRGLTKEKGMRRVYLLRDPERRNEFVSLTLWNSRRDADAYESSGRFSTNIDKVRALLERDPVTSQFEVEYHGVSPALPPPAAAKRKRAARKS